MKGFIYLSEDNYLNKNVVKEIKEYKDCKKIITIYGEIYKIKKEENKNAN